MSDYEQKLTTINEKTTSLNDQLILMKLFITEPMIYVDPEHQRQGVGGKLLKISNVRSVWVMEGNIKAENFYRKNRYKAVDSRETTKLGHDITETKWVKNENNTS